MQKKSKLIYAAAAAIFIFAVIASVFFLTQDVDQLRDKVEKILEMAQNSLWSFPIVCALYVLSSAIMFPVMALNFATAIVFGPVYGFIYALCGTLLSGTVFFFIGRFGRDRGLKQLLSGPRLSKLDDKLKDSGVIGITMLRLVPLAPFGIFNMAAGITSLRYLDYILGTFIAYWPGGIARALVGDSLVKLFLEPTQESILYLACGLTIWAVIILSLHIGLKKFRSQTS